MSQTYKTHFSRTVAMAGSAAVALATLMLANGWAETDSFLGEQLILGPASDVYLGDDENVRDAAGVGTYQGQLIAGGESINLAAYRDEGSLVDPWTIWLYSAGGQNVAINYTGI